MDGDIYSDEYIQGLEAESDAYRFEVWNVWREDTLKGQYESYNEAFAALLRMQPASVGEALENGYRIRKEALR